MALPTGTTHYLDITVNHTRVNETADNFMYQIDLSSLITSIDAIINSENNITVTNTDGSTIYPKYAIYTEGSKLLLYWSGPKSTSSNNIFRVCFGSTLNVVNSTSTFSNSNIAHYWGFDKFNGNTFYDYVGGRDGTGTSVDTVTSSFGVGVNFNAVTDGINCGYATSLSNKTEFTITGTFRVTSTTGTQYFLMFYKNTTDKIYIYLDAASLYVSSGGAYYGSLARSGNIATNTTYNFVFTYGSSTCKFYLNGVQKTLTDSGTPVSVTGDLSTTDMLFGRYSGTNSFTGVLDEVGIMTVERSANAILDRYRTLFEPSTFFTLGSITENNPITTKIKFTHYNPLKHNEYIKRHEKLIRSLRAYGMNI